MNCGARTVLATALVFSGRVLAVINGATDTQDAAVVSISDCSGTLVAPHVVLTAAHCVRLTPPGSLLVSVGNSRMAPTATVRALEVHLHPDYDPSTDDFDAALLFIDPPLAGVAPLPVLSIPLSDADIGAQLRIIGFGVSAHDRPDTDGTKRQGTTKLIAYLHDTLVDAATPAATCTGDSGGPALLDIGGVEYVAGVTSRGDAACQSFGIKTRVDTLAGVFIQPYIAATLPGGTPTGGHCSIDRQCPPGGRCLAAIDDPAVHYCSIPCTAGAGCPDVMMCDSGSCRYAAPTPGAVGSSCDRNSDCVSRICSRARGDQASVCTTECTATGSSCNRGFECRADARADGTFICVPHASAGGCAISSGGSAIPLTPAFALVLLIWWERRRKRISPRRD